MTRSRSVDRAVTEARDLQPRRSVCFVHYYMWRRDACCDREAESSVCQHGSQSVDVLVLQDFRVCCCTHAHERKHASVSIFVALLSRVSGSATSQFAMFCATFCNKKERLPLDVKRRGGAGCYEFITGAGNEAAASRGQQPPLAFARSSLVSDKLLAFKKRKKKSMKNIDGRIRDCANLR